jgi:NADPH:quinone reductase-like Zn-dependent oxidoreductase
MGRRRFRWCWGGTYPDRSPPWARASAIGVLEAGRDGAYAEKLAITAAIIAKKPDRLSHVDAAALALTGLSAIISVEATNFSAARPSSSTAGPAGWRAYRRFRETSLPPYRDKGSKVIQLCVMHLLALLIALCRL